MLSELQEEFGYFAENASKIKKKKCEPIYALSVVSLAYAYCYMKLWGYYTVKYVSGDVEMQE